MADTTKFQILIILASTIMTICGQKTIARTHIGDACNDGTNVCDSDTHLLVCDVRGTIGTCRCNENLAFQVDFLGYATAQICLIRGRAHCNQRGTDLVRTMFEVEATKLKELMLNSTMTVRNGSVTEADFSPEILDTLNTLKVKYEDAANTTVWTDFVDDYFGNFIRDLQSFYKERSLQDVPCASGKCDLTSFSCTIGINTKHRRSGKQRKFLPSSTFRLLGKQHLYILAAIGILAFSSLFSNHI